jgi:hypothetical protein
MATCKNCGAETSGKYCINCGMESDPKRLAVKSILHDVTHGIIHWENSILRTFRQLVVSPGKAARKYIDGARKSIVKPFAYFIFIQTVYVVVFHWMSGKFFAFLNFTLDNPQNIQEAAARFQQIINSYVNYLNYFMPLVFAFYLWLFYRKRTGFNYAEFISASLYWIGTTLVFGIVLMLLANIDIRIWNLRFFVNLFYLVFAIGQFTGSFKFGSVIKSFLIVVLSYLSFSLIVTGLIALYFLITSGRVSFH